MKYETQGCSERMDENMDEILRNNMIKYIRMDG